MQHFKIGIKSFTLQETLVVLLLSAILIGLVYYALRYMAGDITRLQENGAYGMELGALKTKLQDDFDHAINIHQAGQHELWIWQTKAAKPDVYWFFSDSICVRQTQNSADETRTNIPFACAGQFVLIPATPAMIDQTLLGLLYTHAPKKQQGSTLFYATDTVLFTILSSTGWLTRTTPEPTTTQPADGY